MLRYIIPLIATTASLWTYALNFIFCLAFIATIPCLIRDILRR